MARKLMYPQGTLARTVMNTIIIEFTDKAFGETKLIDAVLKKLPKAKPHSIKNQMKILVLRRTVKKLSPDAVTGDRMYSYVPNRSPRPQVLKEEKETFSVWDIGKGVVEYIELLKSEIKRLENEVRVLNKQRNALQEVCNNMKQEKGLPVSEIMNRG